MAKPVSRNRISLLNAITSLGMTVVNGILGIVITRLVIGQYGSDFNGLNATANQIINMLLILEGGFTLASNVMLFAPLTEGNYRRVNEILATTRKKFRKTGIVFLAVGCIVALGYALVINSELPTELVFTVIMMALVPPAVNLYFATTCRVLLQTQQKEYVISLITMATITLGYLGNAAVVFAKGPMWMIRLTTMASALINSLWIVRYTKRHNRFLELPNTCEDVPIRGTRDVLTQKITGVVYFNVPIVFLSISPVGGTVLASVYAVYNNVFTMIKSLLRGVIDAPRQSLGQMLSEKKREDVWSVFAQYEYLAFFMVFVTVTTAYVLILPFISLYTSGITDANYYDNTIALIMTLIAAMEMIHIPSGNLMNMAGEFRISRNFQITACGVLIVSMITFGSIWGVYGILTAILLVAILLALLEIGFIHTRFFPGKWKQVFRMILPMAGAAVGACWLGTQLFSRINGVLMFLFAGCCLAVINGTIASVVSLIFNRNIFLGLLRRARSLLKKGD